MPGWRRIHRRKVDSLLAKRLDYGGMKNPAAVALGRLGGRAKSAKKTAAARKNAQKPRKRSVKRAA